MKRTIMNREFFMKWMHVTNAFIEGIGILKKDENGKWVETDELNLCEDNEYRVKSEEEVIDYDQPLVELGFEDFTLDVFKVVKYKTVRDLLSNHPKHLFKGIILFERRKNDLQGLHDDVNKIITKKYGVNFMVHHIAYQKKGM